jgi:type I restriction-modification system DNA methylase subunit
MVFDQGKFQAVMTGGEEQRVEALRQLLDYPVKAKDSEGSRFWYVRPGNDELEAENTCPIAVGFFKELNQGGKREIEQWLTDDDQDKQIRGHYTGRIATEQPVMYVLLPEGNSQGNVALVLPTESRLRQRSIQVFDWTAQDLQARFNRLSWESLAQKVTERITGFVPQVDWIFFKPAATAKELAQLLAAVARRIEQVMPEVYEAEGEEGYLHNLLKSFRKELIANLKLKADNDKDYSFADIYAQTIAYGLFTARVFSFVKNPKADFSRHRAWSQLPETNPFLRQLFKDISEQSADDLGDELVDAISEAIAILRAAEMDAILADFRSKMNREDIVIRFYEDFLAAYKPTMRERRGVYYTPEPVVSYMVRSVDELIKDKFDKPLGIADPEVMILDPACGTGTFLLWIFKLIHERHQANPEAFEYSDWNDYVDHCLLPRIFGFELLMAPYAICHLKLGLFLEESGYKFESGQRLGVYLTNTLDEAVKKREMLIQEYITDESNEAADIKRDKSIMVVIGNPPYSISSANKSKFIEQLLSKYKTAVRSEKNIQPLSDDYIKFLRFAHYQVEKTGYGIISFISNHSYINGLIHRGVREEILKTFDNLFVIDLHGNSLLKETPPEGYSIDQNVFDIQQGVSIINLVKSVKKSNSLDLEQGLYPIQYYELWGDRDVKYQFLDKNNIKTTEWIAVKSSPSNFFFSPQNKNFQNEYLNNDSLTDIFDKFATGIETGKDSCFVKFSVNELSPVIQDLYDSSLTLADLKDKYDFEQTSGWTVDKKRKDLLKTSLNKSLFRSYCYRPFDNRFIYYSDFLRRPHTDIMQDLLEKNLALMVSRQQTKVGFTHVFLTDKIADCNALSLNSRERNYYFILYINPDGNSNQKNFFDLKIRSNFSQRFLESISSKLGYIPIPEAIFYYIYGIFHSPTYRTRYAEFLKIDFPRVPLTSDDRLFRQLADYGEQLVGLHLMTSPKLDNLITEFTEEGGERTVAPGHPKYSDGKVNINKQGDGFVGVPEEVWNFYVGGYQVCQKWLKDRKGRVLSDEDILHYQKIVVALQETIKLMQLIDEAIPSWPIE